MTSSPEGPQDHRTGTAKERARRRGVWFLWAPARRDPPGVTADGRGKTPHGTGGFALRRVTRSKRSLHQTKKMQKKIELYPPEPSRAAQLRMRPSISYL